MARVVRIADATSASFVSFEDMRGSVTRVESGGQGVEAGRGEGWRVLQ